MAVATISSPSQFFLSMLAGVLLAGIAFAASALLTSKTSDFSASAGLAIQLGGFLARLGLVAVALFVCVRMAHLQAVPLGAGLAGGFTVLAVLAVVRELRGRHPAGTRH